MEEQKTVTQTQSGDLWTAAARLANSRSLLDLAAEYILSGQEDRTDGEKLDTVLFAIEKARDEARAAEDEVGRYSPYRPSCCFSIDTIYPSKVLTDPPGSASEQPQASP